MWKVKQEKDEVMILFSVPEAYLLMQPLPRGVWEGSPVWERWTQQRSRWSWLWRRRRLTASSGGSSEDLSSPNPWRHGGKTEERKESQGEDVDQNMLYQNRTRVVFCWWRLFFKCITSSKGFFFAETIIYIYRIFFTLCRIICLCFTRKQETRKLD